MTKKETKVSGSDSSPVNWGTHIRIVQAKAAVGMVRSQHLGSDVCRISRNACHIAHDEIMCGAFCNVAGWRTVEGAIQRAR